MKLLKSLALQSPNVWDRAPILEVWLAQGTAGPAAALDPATLAQRIARLAAPYVTAAELPPADEAAGAAIGVPPSWLEYLTRKLQSLAGVELPPGRVVPAPQAGIYRVAIYFEDEGLVRAALDVVLALVAAAQADQAYDFATQLRALESLANELCIGPSTRAIVLAARKRRIPVRRLNENSFVQFGLGSQQRRICTAETANTGAIAESIAQDKELTKSLLARAGVPVPKGQTATSPEEAWQVACDLGLPVVIKPLDGNHGRGVAICLTDRDRIIAAYNIAAREGSGVLIEQFVVGRQTRILVVNNRFVAATRAQPEQVEGDGVHTIRELVDIVNQDPRRGDAYALPMSRMKLNDPAVVELAEQGFEPSSVPAAGAFAVLHRHGEYTTDVTDLVHPEVAARAVLAARVVGLDVAGIDMVLEDVSRPMEEQGGMVIEVNAGPQLQMHSEPQIGQPRPVGAAIVETLFSGGKSGRIPIVAVTSGPAAEATAAVTAHLLATAGMTVGRATAAGTFVGERNLSTRFPRRPGPAELFLNPLVDAGVFEIGPQEVYEEGLAFDESDVAIIEPLPAGAELLRHEIQPPDAWRRVVLENVAPQGTAVLAADDPEAERLAALSSGGVLLYHLSAGHPLVQKHRAAGGKVVFVRDAAVWGATANREVRLADCVDRSPPPRAVLAGLAAAWSIGIPDESTQRGLATLGDSSGPLIPPAAGPSGAAAACSEQPRVA